MLRGWWRSRLSALSALLVCVALGLMTLLSGQFDARISTTLNANWRGLYDILVTPRAQDFGGAATAGLVDPNFVATAGGGGISLDQLARIRALSNVEVAAPIGMVGALRQMALSPTLYVIDDPESGNTVLPHGITLVRLTTTLVRTTSQGDHELSRGTGVVALEARDGTGDLSSFHAMGTAGYDPVWSDSNYWVPLGQLPAFASTVMAIDPAAEIQLLGPERSSVLGALAQDLPARQTSAGERGWLELVDGSMFEVQRAELAAALQEPGKTIVPLVVNESLEGTLSLHLVMEISSTSADVVPTSRAELDSLIEQAQFQPLGIVETNVSGIAVPFSSPDLALLWPGSTLPEGEGAGHFYLPSTSLEPLLIGRPDYTATASPSSKGSVTPSFRVEPKGAVRPDGLLPEQVENLFGQDLEAGVVQAYRLSRPASGDGFAQALPAPLATFSAASIVDPDREAASYVPSGAYSGNETWSEDWSSVWANLSNLDFITAPPGAFTDLAGGQALRGSTPVDAVRVRVAGVESYTPASQARIAKVAGGIELLGLTATIVAGSSPQAVNLYVPDYFVGASEPVDLGWVTQEWTTLGASVTVQSATEGIGRWLVWGALGSVAAGLLVADVLAGRGERREVVILRMVGWARPQIQRRLIARRLPGLVLVLLVSSVCALVSPPGARASIGVVTFVAVIAAVSGTIVALVRRQPATGGAASLSSGLEVGTWRRLALRQVLRSPLSAALQIGGIALVGGLAGLATAMVLRSLQLSGETRLAELVVSITGAGILGLAGAGAASALLMIVIGRLIDLQRRRSDREVFRVVGFVEREQRRLIAIEDLILGFVALTAGIAIAAPVVIVADQGPVPWIASAVAMLLAITLRALLRGSASLGHVS